MPDDSQSRFSLLRRQNQRCLRWVVGWMRDVLGKSKMRKTYPRLTKPCPTCGYIMKDACAADCEENGGGWWWCTPCDKETLPVWYGFQMYDSVEIIGMTDWDGSKVTGGVKGGKDGKVGVSTDGFYGFFEPEKLKLRGRVRPTEVKE